MYLYLPLRLLARRCRIKDDFTILSLGVVGNALLIPVCRLLGLRAVVFAYAEELTMPLKGAGLKNAFKRFLLINLYNKANAFVAVSQFTKNTLIAIGAEPKTIKIIWPPINTAKTRPGSPGGAVEGKRILSVGRMVRRKGFDKLIAAVNRLRIDMPQVRLWIVGDGSERHELESLVTRLGLQGHVSLKGEVSDEELASLYRDCEVFALANVILENGDCEGSPTVLIEASAYGKPVIAGDGTGADAMVRHGETGYLVDAANVDSLVRRLDELLRDPALAARMGMAGRRKAEQFHTPQHAGARLCDFLATQLKEEAAC